MRFLEPFEAFRIPLARGPSPLEPHAGLSAELGVRLLLKRDDQLDDLASGHKLRKLEYVVGNALQAGVDTLVTAGGPQSNQCKAVAYVATRLGLRCRLVFCADERPEAARGNHLLAVLLGARQSWVGVAEWARIDAHLRDAAEEEERAGHHPWIIPPGASDWVGALGHIRFAEELAAQEATLGEAIGTLVMPTGSGGMHAGIVAGAALLGRPWRIIGVAILGDRGYFRQRHAEIMAELVAQAGLPPEIAAAEPEIDDSATGGGYGCFEPADLDEMASLAQRHALVLDPVYMMKAMRGLRGLIAQGRIGAGTTVVLVHSGGQYGLFGLDGNFQSHLRERFPAGFAAPITSPPASGG